ncbi:hypothetical protein EUX98_g9025 [Antrodiella citrinella]|uniref:DUF6532 domain-containing protein n=1 Tax=Antrodiella citrinella TaxID=2447956 RepID=A0A4S4M5D2_9APHY|nr:hypothetical protein EUX98_g9025 [Antrodiella citrinella]
MPKVVTTKVKGDAPNVARGKSKLTPAKARAAPQPVSTEDHARPPRKAKTNANAKWEELVPGRKRAHSNTQPQPTKRTKSANVQGVGAVGNSAKRSKAARPAPAVKPPGVARRALVPRHDDEYSSDGDVVPNYTAGARYNAAVELMDLDPSSDPEDDGNEGGNEDDEDAEGSQLEEEDEDFVEEDQDDEDEDDVRPGEVPAWTADLRDDTPLPDSFADVPRSSDRKTSKPVARGVSRLSTDASDEEPIVYVKNLAEGLFDDNLDLVKTKKAKLRKTTAAQLRKKAKEEPTFSASEAEVSGDEAELVDDDGALLDSNDDRYLLGVGDDGSDDTGNSDNNDAPFVWPVWTNLSLTPSGIANLVPQNPHIRRAVNRAITLIEHDFAFITGYPEMNGKSQYMHANIVEGARTSQIPRILINRFETDEGFRRALIIHPANRLSHARKDIKDIVASQIVPQLKLAPRGTLLPPSLVSKITQDLFVNRAYVYPSMSDTDPRPCLSRPFQSPLLLEVIRLAYFKDPSSVGNVYVKELKSSLPDKPLELEIPRSMLLMAVVAVHAVIGWWFTGRPVPVPFHVDTGVAYYRAAGLFLDDVLRGAGPLRGHRMLVTILDLVRSVAPADVGDATEDAGVVDYDNMPE